MPNAGRSEMTLCPIALVASCTKCPAFSACPLKSVLGDGDYEKPGDVQTKQELENEQSNEKREQ